jgi:hypothetical protein
MSGVVAQNVGRRSGLVKAVAAGGGEWTLISTLTSGGSDDDLSFTSGIDSTYDTYCFKFINIHPETDAATFQFQGNAAGGSGYNETITSNYFVAWHMESDSSAGLSYGGAAADLEQGTDPQRLSQNVGNDNDQAVSGELYLFAPSDTTFVKHFMCRSTTIADDNGPVDVQLGGYFNTTSAIDEIQFTMSADEIQGGSISLYGIG